MQRIKKLTDDMLDELCSAKDYAECYLDKKAHNDGTWANRFKEMANDELKHAMYLHELAVGEIDQLRAVYTPPEEMQEEWDKDHKKYIEKTAWIKMMLNM